MLLNTKQAAEYLTLQPCTLEAWRVSGSKIPFVKLGKAVRYKKENLDAFIESQKRNSTSDARNQ